MDKNLDIDRISLEERIRKLEARAPTVLPGTGIASDVSLDPKLVDQVQPNSFTDLGTGLLWYLSIDNFYDLTPVNQGASSNFVFLNKSFNGLEIKIAHWFPRVNGIILGVHTTMCRFRITAPLSNVPAPLANGIKYYGNYNIQFHDQGVKDLLTKFTYDHRTPILNLPAVNYQHLFQVGFMNPQGALDQEFMGVFQCYYRVFDTPPPTPFYNFVFYTWGAYYDANSKVNLYRQTSPSTAFGVWTTSGIFPPFPIADTTVGITTKQAYRYGAYTVKLPSDIPLELKPIYPPSWTT